MRTFATLALPALALTLPIAAPAAAETSCDIVRTAQDTVVTVRGRIKSVDVDRGDKSYWLVIELRDQCGLLDVRVSTRQAPRCRAGAMVSVTGPLKGTTEHMIETPRVTCVK